MRAGSARSATDGRGGIRLGCEMSPVARAGGLTPIGEDFVRFGDVFLRTGEVEGQFSGLAGDLHYDGVEAIAFHARVELFVGFPGAVFLEAISHD